MSNNGVHLTSALRSFSVIQKMAQFDWSSTTSCKYRSHLVRTIFELFDVEEFVTFKSTLVVTQGHCKWHQSIDRIRVSIRLPLQLMVLSCTVFEIKRDIGRKSRFSYPFYITTPWTTTVANIFSLFFSQPSRQIRYRWCK